LIDEGSVDANTACRTKQNLPLPPFDDFEVGNFVPNEMPQSALHREGTEYDGLAKVSGQADAYQKAPARHAVSRGNALAQG